MPRPPERHTSPAVRHALRRVRARLYAQRAVRAMLWTVVAASAGALAAVFAEWLGVAVDSAVAISGTVLVTLLVLAYLARRERWTPVRVARRIERRMDWRERLSTALETPPDETVVATALHAEVGRLVETLDVRRVAPWTWPRTLLATAAIAGFTALAANTLTLVPRSEAIAPGLVDGAPEASTDATSASPEALLRLAEAIETDAERRIDPYLAGVADALRDLAERIERGDIEADDQRPALESVLEHLARAYESDMSGAELAERLMASPPAQDPTDREVDEPPPFDSLRFSADDLDEGDLERLLAAVDEPPPDDPGASGTGGAPPPGTRMTGYGSQELRDIAEARRQQGGDLAPPGPGELVGAADDADAGASQLAGRGSQALEGEIVAPLADSSVEDLLAVRGRERDDGRRIDVELPSSVGWDDYDDAAFAVGPWQRRPEPAIETDTTDPRYRPIAGRFFVPTHETVNHARRDAP